MVHREMPELCTKRHHPHFSIGSSLWSGFVIHVRVSQQKQWHLLGETDPSCVGGDSCSSPAIRFNKFLIMTFFFTSIQLVQIIFSLWFAFTAHSDSSSDTIRPTIRMRGTNKNLACCAYMLRILLRRPADRTHFWHFSLHFFSFNFFISVFESQRIVVKTPFACRSVWLRFRTLLLVVAHNLYDFISHSVHECVNTMRCVFRFFPASVSRSHFSAFSAAEW